MYRSSVRRRQVRRRYRHRNWGRIQALDPRRFDERFGRIWRAYLYGCAEMFRSPVGRLHLFLLLALPLDRRE